MERARIILDENPHVCFNRVWQHRGLEGRSDLCGTPKTMQPRKVFGVPSLAGA